VSDQIEEVVSVVENTPTLNTSFKIMATPKIQKKHSTCKKSLTYKAQPTLSKSLFSEKPKQSKNVSAKPKGKTNTEEKGISKSY